MNQTQLSALLTPVLSAHGLELEGIEVIPAGRRRLLRVVVDGEGPKGQGPGLEEIAEATAAVSAALDSSDAVGQAPYTLEVSSRGVDRPLREPRHWRRNTGRLVRATLTGGSQLTGRIIAADEEGVEVDVGGQPRRLSYGEVARGLVQVEFNRPTEEKED